MSADGGGPVVGAEIKSERVDLVYIITEIPLRFNVHIINACKELHSIT